MIFVKSIVVWLVFILLESLNGAIRIFWLVPSLGDSRAQQIAFMTGSVLVLTVATLYIRWIQASRSQLLSVGMLWMVLTLSFEIVLGRVIFGYSWEQIAAKFNVLNGELMPFELVLLVLAPLIAVKIRDTFTNLKTSADKQSPTKENYDYENTNDFG
jgi:hypothetical protein